MLISELSERTGTPAATIKYYVRENLLPAGERVGGNRTEYTDEHARRLKLIRAMLEVGKLSIAAVRTVLDALDAPDAPVINAFDAAQVIDAFDNAGFPLPDAYLDSYAAAARLQAEADLDTVGVLPDPARMTELVVVGTVLGDTLALGLRRMAQAVVTTERRTP